MIERDDFIEQAKLLRVLQLIRLLREKYGYQVAQLGQALDCDRSTIYRYLKLLTGVGYLIVKDKRGRHAISAEEPTDQPYFSAAETEVLRQSLSGLPINHPLRESLQRKIYLTSDLIPLADELAEAQHGRMVEQLTEACRQRHRVRLVRYHSSNSDTCRDRLVEPHSFSRNYGLLNAVEVESSEVRTFKISRIGRVELLTDQPSTFPPAEEYLDAFGLAAQRPIAMVLHLTERAYRLLWEEVPAVRAFLLAAPHEAVAGFPYQFRGEVASFLGIGRFVLGQPTEVRVVEPVAFRDYLRRRVTEAVW